MSIQPTCRQIRDTMPFAALIGAELVAGLSLPAPLSP